MLTEEIATMKLLVEIGLLDPRADEFSAYMLEGQVSNDPVVWARRWELARTTGNTLKLDGTRIVIEKMTEPEREALRERIFQKHAATVRVGA